MTEQNFLSQPEIMILEETNNYVNRHWTKQINVQILNASVMKKCIKYKWTCPQI